MADDAFDFGALLSDPTGAGSVDFSTLGLIVTADRSPAWIRTGTQVVEASFSPASNAYGPAYRPRYLVYECKIIGTSELNRQSKLDDIIYYLQTNADRVLQPHHRADRFYMARFYDHSDPVWLGEGAVRVTLTFLARDGRAYASGDEIVQTEVLAGAGGDFDVEGDGPAEPVPGNIFTDPVWIIKDLTNGASGITLTNETRDEGVAISGAFTSSEWIRINSIPDQLRVEKSVDSGANWTSIMTRVSGTLPILNPRVVNAMNVDGFTNGGTVVCTYRGRYQ